MTSRDKKLTQAQAVAWIDRWDYTDRALIQQALDLLPTPGLLRVWLTSLTRDGVPRKGCRYAEEVSAGVQA